MTSNTMHPRTTELLAHLDAQRAYLRATVDAFPPDKLSVEPAPGRWSALGVLEHVAIVESRLAAMLKNKIDEARAAGLGAETELTPILPALRVDRFTNRSTKIKGSDALQPRGGRDLGALWQALDESRAALRGVLIGADGLALSQVTHPHPAFGPLDAYAWFAFLGSHETRHADQIREIGASLTGS